MLKKILQVVGITTLFATYLIPSAYAEKTSVAQQSKPNVVVIMTDEHNFRTLGAYRKLMNKKQSYMWGANPVTTPNIDWLAEQGAIATSFYSSSPVCTPARGSFVSGMYPQNNGAYTNHVPLSDDVITFAQVLKNNGYATGYIGKWHLDGLGKPQWSPKRKFGFDDNRYMYNRGHYKQFVDTKDGAKVPVINAKGEPSYSTDGADEKSFSTDYQFGKMLSFIDNHINSDKEQPFMMMLSLSDPHGPDTVRAPYDTMYADVDFKLPHTYNVDPKQAPIWAKPDLKQNKMANYYGMIKLIDDNMARLFSKLKQTKLLDNTIIIFTSDHGDLKGEHGRQNKSNPFEGSARVPFIVYYPKKITGGTVVKQALTTVDFQQTLLGLVGIEGSGNEEGRDGSPLFVKSNSAKSTFVSKWQDIAFIRQASTTGSGWLTAVTDRYKLIYNPEGEPWLFDLQADPDELINFYTVPAYRETIHFMATKLKQYEIKRNDIFLLNNDHMSAQVEKAIANEPVEQAQHFSKSRI